MKLTFSKIILSLALLCSIAFAGGIEEDSGPDQVSEQDKKKMTNSDTDLTTREDINEYQALSVVDCKVTYSAGYVNDPDYVAWVCK